MPTRAASGSPAGVSSPRQRLDQREPGPDRPLGLVLVRLRPAEIGEHAVAHVLGDVTRPALDHLGAAFLIGADHLAHVLGIEPRRQRGRADQIAEHHRQLAALGCRVARGAASVRAVRAVGASTLSAAMASSSLRRWPTEVTPRRQVLGGQPRQHLGVDVVGAERLG